MKIIFYIFLFLSILLLFIIYDYNNKKKELIKNNEVKERLYELDELNNKIKEKREELIKQKENFSTELEKECEKLNQQFQIKINLMEMQVADIEQRCLIKKQEYIDEEEQYKIKINDFKEHQRSINEAIQREKELKEKEKFYLLQFSEQDIEDIKELKKLENNFNNKEALNKLIYNVYIQRPLQELQKRVLNGNKIAGIYKITYLPTGEAYIGRSTDVGNRWSEHIKSSLNIGTIAHTSFHIRLSNDGIWNYSWELLEKVDKDKLNEREKFYIDLYQTNKIGLNSKEGG